MLLANETVAAHLVSHDVPSLHRVHEAPDVKKVARLRGLHHDARLQPGGDRPHRPPEALPEADRSDARHAGRASDRRADAADDAEGALRRGEPRALRAGGGATTRTSRRRSAAIPISSCTACCASHGTARLPEARREELDEDLPESRAAHVGDGAARRRGRARAAAVEEGPLHGRQGRRRVRRATSPASRRSACSSSWSSTTSRGWCTSRAWPTTTTASSTSSTSCWARTRRRSTGWETRSWYRWSASTWSGGRSTWGWWISSRRYAGKSGRAGRCAAPREPKKEKTRAQRPGRRERQGRQGKRPGRPLTRTSRRGRRLPWSRP